ncbi:MAG TPA: MipA/OmpV family protein [Burkholderiales bacterium]|nr:MipA/OmpV family protein [Burkholderiales bacterium]
MRTLLIVFCGIAACACSQAFAQATDDEKYIGVGARVRPAYEGADTNRVDPIPYLRLYGEHFFARTTQGILEVGWRTRPFGGVVFGAQLAYEEGIKADESAFLTEHHFADLDPSVSLGLHAEGDWKIGPMPLNVLLRYRHDVDSDNGSQADLRATAGILSWGRMRAGLFWQVTWGDEKSAQRYFGITPQQAATTGLPAYSPGSGARSIQAGLLGDVDIAKHWLGLWGITYQRLQDDTAGSPIVQDRNNWYANAGIAYRF